jgi:hypothetical protein
MPSTISVPMGGNSTPDFTSAFGNIWHWEDPGAGCWWFIPLNPSEVLRIHETESEVIETRTLCAVNDTFWHSMEDCEDQGESR